MNAHNDAGSIFQKPAAKTNWAAEMREGGSKNYIELIERSAFPSTVSDTVGFGYLSSPPMLLHVNAVLQSNVFVFFCLPPPRKTCPVGGHRPQPVLNNGFVRNAIGTLQNDPEVLDSPG